MRQFLRTLSNWFFLALPPIALAVLLVFSVFMFQRLFEPFSWFGLKATMQSNGNVIPAKTFWDWLDLLIVPLILALGGLVINQTIRREEEKRTQEQEKAEQVRTEKQAEIEREIALDLHQQQVLYDYLELMSGLLLHEGLRDSAEEDDVRRIARIRTLAVLPNLEGDRKGAIMLFLYEAGLISGEVPIVNISSADFSKAKLAGAILENTNLNHVNLMGAHLQGSLMRASQFRWANLEGANFRDAQLGDAVFLEANMANTCLINAKLWRSQFIGAHLENANMTEAHMASAKLEDAHLENAILNGANLSNANLKYTWLEDTQLIGTDFKEAYLYNVFLNRANATLADFTDADLENAYLTGTSLISANLKGANLMNARVTLEQLQQAMSLEGATMPDGTIYTSKTND